MTDVDALLTRWLGAGILEEGSAERIRQFEAQAPAGQHLQWPVILAITFGTLMIGGGLLLFVAAHWDRLSPAIRFLAVLSKVAVFHLAGLWFTDRMPKLATALHGLGTLALGAGIYLAGQIFNLQEHWPGGIMLWALGAWLGYALLRDRASGEPGGYPDARLAHRGMAGGHSTRLGHGRRGRKDSGHCLFPAGYHLFDRAA